ncbi:hypothetical protein [Nocardia jejuensis]|uniref:hypothetical protein n=1 Tax=Nocardia jejuensis TaxID=328049 RepID=UPI000A002770|nr:hypothetical protein [Nocardia jejuensis]
MTQEEGTVSGDLDVAVDSSGVGMVRYRDTETWYHIGNLDDRPPVTWSTINDLVVAIEKGQGARDAAGNTIPFEA